VVRPDTSQVRGYRANGPGLSGVAAEQAAVEDDAPSVARAARLGVVWLVSSRRLRPYVVSSPCSSGRATTLRSEPVAGPRRWCEVVVHEREVARSFGSRTRGMRRASCDRRGLAAAVRDGGSWLSSGVVGENSTAGSRVGGFAGLGDGPASESPRRRLWTRSGIWVTDEQCLPPGRFALAISTAVVRALASTTGRGQTKANTTLGEKAVFVVLQDTLTRGELNLVQAGESEAVLGLRRRWQKIMRSSCSREIEQLTGRRVIGSYERQSHRPGHRGRGVHSRADWDGPRDPGRHRGGRPGVRVTVPLKDLGPPDVTIAGRQHAVFFESLSRVRPSRLARRLLTASDVIVNHRGCIIRTDPKPSSTDFRAELSSGGRVRPARIPVAVLHRAVLARDGGKLLHDSHVRASMPLDPAWH
jgi:uncharacterized protein YbcI